MTNTGTREVAAHNGNGTAETYADELNEAAAAEHRAGTYKVRPTNGQWR
jgi:hypothetical protein